MKPASTVDSDRFERNTPLKLRQLHRWIVWREETVEGRKTKVPYRSFGGYAKAAVNDPKYFNSFDKVMACFASGAFTGIGFCIMPQDGLIFIDIDDPKYFHVIDHFNSYTETSFSKRGYHILCTGVIEKNRHLPGIEIYNKDRYVAFTAEIYQNKRTIEYQQDALDWLMANVFAPQPRVSGDNVIMFTAPEKDSDEEVMNKLFHAVDQKEKVQDLINCNWDKYYPSQSEADNAFIRYLSWITRNPEQIQRIFLSTGLGQRAKAHRLDYIPNTIKKILSEEQTYRQFEGDPESRARLDASIEAYAQRRNAPQPIMPKLQYEFPPGWIGQIMAYVLSASEWPNRGVALAAGLTAATICARGYNVSGDGLNLYTVLVGQTGIGKEAANASIGKLFYATRKLFDSIENYYQPAPVSGPALLGALVRPCHFSMLGEFGHLLQAMSHGKPNAPENSLLREILNMFGKGGDQQYHKGLSYSDKAKNKPPIESPCFSFMGDCTPTSLFKGVTERLFHDGTMGRLIFIVADELGELNHGGATVRPSEELVKKYSEVAMHVATLETTGHRRVCNIDFSHPCIVSYQKEAAAKYRHEPDEIVRAMWSRAYQHVLKLAAYCAISINYQAPVISEFCMHWGRSIIEPSIGMILDNYKRGEISGIEDTLKDDQFGKRLNTMISFFKQCINEPEEMSRKYGQGSERGHPALLQQGIISWSVVSRRFASTPLFKSKTKSLLLETLNEMVDRFMIGEANQHGQIVPHDPGKPRAGRDKNAVPFYKVINLG